MWVVHQWKEGWVVGTENPDANAFKRVDSDRGLLSV